MDNSAHSNTQQSSADQPEMDSSQTINRNSQINNAVNNDQGFQKVQRRKQNQERINQNKQRKLRQVLLTQQREIATPTFPKYFSVQFPRISIEKEINLIALDKSIKNKIGIPVQIKKQNRDTLLIQVRSSNQGNLLREITELTGLQVTVQEHKTLNQCKGTVYSEALSNSSIEEIQEALEEQNVIKVERLKARIRG